MARGRFITLEGGEGVGKSTQARLLADRLRTQGMTVVETREPGGSPAAERVRDTLLGLPEDVGVWDRDAECLLHYAARRQHVSDVIEPALADGRWVVCDRFADSTMAYQGYATGLGRARVEALHAWTLGDLKPDLTLILDLPVADSADRVRARGRASDIYERKPDAFHEAVLAGFREIAAREPERCLLIDAARPVETVAAAIAEALADRLGVV